MIDYDKPDDDEIVAEVRQAREELSREFNGNLRAAFEEMRRRQQTSGRQYASLPIRRANSSTSTRKAG
jgi:hypothetical protein